MHALKQDLKKKGKEFIQLPQKIGQYLNQAIAQVPVNWPSVRSEINHMIYQSRDLSHYDQERIHRAAQSIVCQLKYKKI
ncbi:MAG: hypothetical protein J7540_09365 [Roseofilum sp. SID2]|nr:hypothetical protein [Roseofilum sp. SID1]MBP0024190.1 hypothetical protein [Roseofilum sp. SID2]